MPDDKGNLTKKEPEKLVARQAVKSFFGRPYARFESTTKAGISFVTHQTFANLGVEEALMAACKSKRQANMAIAVAGYMACEGNAMERFQYWVDYNWPSFKPMSDKRASTFFASLDESVQKRFFKLWLAKNPIDETICYLVPSHSTPDPLFDDPPEKGKEIDPNMRVVCYYSRQSSLPLCYDINWGPLSRRWPPTVPLAKSAKNFPGEVTYVTHGGLDMSDLTRKLHQSNHRYLVSCGSDDKLALAAIDKVRGSIVSSRFRVEEGKYSTRVPFTFPGVTTQARISYDVMKAERQKTLLAVSTMYNKVCMTTQTLLFNEPIKLKIPYFICVTKKNGEFDYQPNHKLLDKAAHNYGYLCSLSNAPFEYEEYTDIHHRYFLVEDAFFNIISHLDGVFTSLDYDKLVSGKMFCAFLALIVRTNFLKAVKHLTENNDAMRYIDEKELIYELNKIEIADLSDGRRILTHIDSPTQLILSALDLDMESLRRYANITHWNSSSETWNSY